MAGNGAGEGLARPGAVVRAAGRGRAAGDRRRRPDERCFYSEAVAAELCAWVAAGRSVRAFCAEPGRPHACTVRNWELRHPEFGVALRAAYRQVLMAQRRADRQAEAELAARPAPVRGGKVSTYTRAVGEAICERLEAGESLTSIGRDPAMPCFGTVLAWVRRHPEFQDMYVAARETQAEYLFDEARDVAKGATRRSVPVARLQFDVIRWQTARLAPKKYLERLVAAEAVAEAEARRPIARRQEMVFSVMHFEKGPKGRVLAVPPRNAEEARRWIEDTGAPYAEGVGPNGQVRPPMDFELR